MTGQYVDKRGRRWTVVERREGHVVCESTDGWYTAASIATFVSWGWERLP